MTAQLLSSELSALIQESRRKNSDLRNAAEKSLNDLKSLPHTSEAQLAADLKSRPHFVRPFLLACNTRNPKIAGTAIVCLQRLVVTKGLRKESLGDALDAFRECSSLALDIQLKVLQALPSLLQNYAGSLTGGLLVAAFQVCFQLHGSKTAVVSNTAAATLQQLVLSSFEKVAIENGQDSGQDSTVEVATADGTIPIHGAALDAYHVLTDLCLLAEGQSPRTLQGAALSQNFGFELIESILANHKDSVMACPEQIHVIRVGLIPLIIKTVSERSNFSATVRTIRLLQLIISHLLFALAPECEIALSLVNHMLDPEAAVLWKRALCLELFRGIHTDSALVRSIYSHFDEQEGKRNIIRDHLATLVRLASENPTAIGLGHQSTIATSTSKPVNESQGGGIIGSIGAAVSMIELNSPGISTHWSTIRTACIDQLDKSEAPPLPTTYIYGLTLTCINTFSEGLARFLLPFTVPNEAKIKRKRRMSPGKPESTSVSANDGEKPPTTSKENALSRNRSFRSKGLLVNPLSLEDHVLHRQIHTSGQMVDNCWPALLAACSTFLNASLDSDYYHALIRSFQKFTQVAGLLDMATPRDAFLTTLGKYAVPSANVATPTLETNFPASVLNGNDNSRNGEDAESDHESSPTPSIISNHQRQSIDHGIFRLTTRNLLCLRALLNLGIALGPVLGRSWLIILEILQQADLILSRSGTMRKQVGGRHSRQSSEDQNTGGVANLPGEFGVEIIAAETAASRMIESTAELSNKAFTDVLKCLCSLLRNVDVPTEQLMGKMRSPQLTLQNENQVVAVTGGPTDASDRANIFIIEKLGDLIHSNLSRLLQSDTTENGWDLLVTVLATVTSSPNLSSNNRIQAAHALNTMALDVAVSKEPISSAQRDEVRSRALDALSKGMSPASNERGQNARDSPSCEIEIQRLALEALRALLEQCGDSLHLGWDSVLAILTSIFDKEKPSENPNAVTTPLKLVRPSFASLQLICSDFLNSVPQSYLPILLEALYSFCTQEQDFNISLTTTTFFRSVSDFLQRDNESITFDHRIMECHSRVDFMDLIYSQDHDVPLPALWLCLLVHLMYVTTDSRIEVRHSALHTLFRIFDASGDQVTASAWRVCFSVVFTQMLSANQREIDEATPTENTDSNKLAWKEWNETAVLLVDGLSKVFAQFLHIIRTNEGFSEMWSGLLDYFKGLLDRQVLSVSNGVFVGMTRLLAEFDDIERLGMTSFYKAWYVWQDSNPGSHTSIPSGKLSNQDALTAYIDCLRQLLRLVGRNLALEQGKKVIEELHLTLISSDTAAYSGDVDRMTPVQKYVMESLTTIPPGIPGVTTELINMTARLVILAFESKGQDRREGPSFVALSKAAMDLLRSFVVDHVNAASEEAPILLSRALQALSVPIRLKYEWQSHGIPPPTWQKATRNAISIVQTFIPAIQEPSDIVQSYSGFFEEVVKLSDGIVTANFPPLSSLTISDVQEDQDFDIDAFSTVRDLLTATLGNYSLPGAVRRSYTKSIFDGSIIHEPHPDDLPGRGQEPLEGLRSKHIGRVQDLSPSPRSKLGYLLLDELFDLVAVHDGSPERIRLAQAAAPYLILRVGITLKAYMLDQPLRGRMPQPLSQRREMLYILRKFVELDPEPKAIPPVQGIAAGNKNHLHHLYPSVLKAMSAAWRDEEMTKALRRVLEVVGEDFGV